MELRVKEFLKEFSQLQVVTPHADLERIISVPEISRPGIELTGYTNHFPFYRVQLMGIQEIRYLESINYDEEILRPFFAHPIPILIICRGLSVDQRFLDLADQAQIPVVVTDEITSKIQSQIFLYLEERLAPQQQIHAECLNVYGTGILIIGASGAGKSELALELINRGHFLIADDSVVLRFVDQGQIIATSPPIIKNRLEIRGLGIIDIPKLYGVTRVLEKVRVELIIEIKEFEGNEERIGLNILYHEINGFKIPKIVIPITPGRNLANLVETAVANFNLKTIHHYDAAKEFTHELNELLKEKDE